MENKQFEELEKHFVSENLRKMILYCGKTLSKEKISERRKFLDRKVRQRKNLYIYPAKVNV